MKNLFSAAGKSQAHRILGAELDQRELVTLIHTLFGFLKGREWRTSRWEEMNLNPALPAPWVLRPKPHKAAVCC